MIQAITTLDPATTREVREYLHRSPHACPEHDPRWLDILREGLKHRPVVLISRSGDASSPINGYLPLALVSTRLFGRFLVSLPYLNRAGVIADDAVAAAALVEEAVRQADRLDVQYLELRHGSPLEHASLPASRDEKVRMVMELPQNEEALWKGMDAKVRNLVRKGDKSELKLRWGGLDVLDAFYDVFAVNMRDLGTPVYSKGLFANILHHISDLAELAVVDYQNQPIACALLVHDLRIDRTGHTAEPGAGDGVVIGSGRAPSTQVPSASALREFNATSANMWMYHKLLLRAMERGSREFDFGRSSVDSGTYRFKKQWGATPRPTVWQYHVRRGDINAVRPDSPKYKRRVETWQKLPVWLTRLVGPSIVRGIP